MVLLNVFFSLYSLFHLDTHPFSDSPSLISPFPLLFPPPSSRMHLSRPLLLPLYHVSSSLALQKRARADMKNAVLAGALTGGMFGMRGGPMATLMGASGMAAFSAAIEWYQHHM